jgi:DNA-binding MarR family transcriptional regulator
MKTSKVDDVNLLAYRGSMTRLAGPVIEPRTEPLQEVLARFVTAYLQDFGAAAQGHGLTATQAKVLMLLTGSGETSAGMSLPMRALAEKLFCDASNVTGIIDRMETRGLVRREVDPADRRIKNVVATENGLDLARQIRADQHRTLEALASLHPAETEAFMQTLTRLLPILEP